eukprot:9049431-Alexandrium_andersonii.AAC.1
MHPPARTWRGQWPELPPPSPWAPGACASERAAFCTVTVFACHAACCVPPTTMSPCGSGGAAGRAPGRAKCPAAGRAGGGSVSYTHLRAHETSAHL